MEQVVGAREEVYDWFNLQIFFAGENSSSKGGKIFERFNRRGLKYILHSSCNWGSASMWLIQGRPDRRRKATAEGGGRSPQENADGNDAADDTNDGGNDDSDGKGEVGDGKNFEKSQMNSRRSLENSLNHY